MRDSLGNTSPPRKTIHRLDPFVAERIAAGEVIERPASVVKELVENSLDAGATEIEVILHEGGRALIEVTDNGCGIPPEELELATERHATSKVRSLDDLENIHSLGFRGEALPSIAAVTHLTITSRTADAPFAHQLNTRGLSAEQKLTVQPPLEFLHTSHGTRIHAANLFSEIPARLKFLKGAAAEVAQTREWLERLALAYPSTGFRLVSDDRTLLSVRPSSELERVRALLTAGEDLPILSTGTEAAVTGQSDSPLSMDRALKVRAYWVQGMSLPQSRKLIQIVNGRAVKDKLLHQAVMNGFRQLLLPGQFPALALFVEMPPALLDVNVHPSKSEVRFLDSGKIFRAIGHAMDQLIQKQMSASAASFSVAASPAVVQSGPGPVPLAQNLSFALDTVLPPQRGFTAVKQSSAPFAAIPTFAPQAPESAPATSALNTPVSGARYLGIAFQTYLLFDRGNELVLIDQHAAHERIRFEALKASVLHGQPQIQQMLLPETAQVDPPQLGAAIATLHTLGFDAEGFGENSIVFRGVPQAWASHTRPGQASRILGEGLKQRLQNLVHRIADSLESITELDASTDPKALREKLLTDEAIFERIANEACRSSVRAGDVLTSEHAHALVEQLFACQHPWNCPHGRPSVVRVPQSRFEEWFLRKVPH